MRNVEINTGPRTGAISGASDDDNSVIGGLKLDVGHEAVSIQASDWSLYHRTSFCSQRDNDVFN